ncbi:hypothetical protein WOLCODRAFT_130494 [Wolfiporia cocos MD-104 SS10]|uniref:Uncharacterized protein n=1 Tax=Wolfiporia cocos (strain MD-104) TaxID=742152 RepID=A0A2H3JDC2_WOLCO|nr:hypothetical protein WOLCODRAFT_130494 [Wolfiporia cocos MD-104 SS10]
MAVDVDDEHPLALELLSLRAAVDRYQHEAHATSVKLQRHSLETTHALERTHFLESENAQLKAELATLRAHPEVTPHPAALQAQELTLALRRLSDKLTLTEETLAARGIELAHVRSDLAKAQHDVAGARELAGKTRAQLDETEARRQQTEAKARAAEEERKLSDLVVREYADLVRTLEGRPRVSPSASSSSTSGSEGVDSSTALVDSLSEGKSGLQKLLEEFNGETEQLGAEIALLRGELAVQSAELQAERKRSEYDRVQLASAQLELEKYQIEDNTAAKMVSRYMKFSQSSTDSLQKAMDNMKARHAATVATLGAELEHLRHTLMAERRQADKLRDALDELTEDISREAYGRRREIALRLAFLGREENLAEGLRRWTRRARESFERVVNSKEDADTSFAVQGVFSGVLHDAETLLEVLNGQPEPEKNELVGSVGRVIAAQIAVNSLTRELQAETDRRLQLERILAQYYVSGHAPHTPIFSQASSLSTAVSSGNAFETANGATLKTQLSERVEREPPSHPIKSAEVVSVQDDQPLLAEGSSSSCDLEQQEHPTVTVITPSDAVPDEDTVVLAPQSEQLASREPLSSSPSAIPVVLDSTDELIGNESALPTSRASHEVREPNVLRSSLNSALPSTNGVLTGSSLEAASIIPKDRIPTTDSVNLSPSSPLSVDDAPTPRSDTHDLSVAVATAAPTHFDNVGISPSQKQNCIDTHVVATLNDTTITPSTIPDVHSNSPTPQSPQADATSVVDLPTHGNILSSQQSDVFESPRAGSLPDDLRLSTLTTQLLDGASQSDSSEQKELLPELQKVKLRYDALQRGFRDCHLALKEVKRELSTLPQTSEKSLILLKAVERLDDYNEDARVELEIRVSDEARIVSGYEALLTIPGAMSDEVNEAEMKAEIRGFVDGTDKAVSKATQLFTRKLDDLEHDIASVKRALHELTTSAEEARPAATPTKLSSSWSSWTTGLLISSRPASPAPTFGSVMTSPRARNMSFSHPRQHSDDSQNASYDPFASLELRIPMPQHVLPASPTLTPPRPRVSTASYMLGLGARSHSLGLGSLATKPALSPISPLALGNKADNDQSSSEDEDLD